PGCLLRYGVRPSRLLWPRCALCRRWEGGGAANPTDPLREPREYHAHADQSAVSCHWHDGVSLGTRSGELQTEGWPTAYDVYPLFVDLCEGRGEMAVGSKSHLADSNRQLAEELRESRKGYTMERPSNHAVLVTAALLRFGSNPKGH